ncbi:MAG: hypothetical protein AAFU67_13585, partial [Bacteroidota bacterium]
NIQFSQNRNSLIISSHKSPARSNFVVMKAIAPFSLFSILLACCFLSCEDNATSPRTLVLDLDYFPLSIGQTKYFEVDSVVLRPVIGGTFYDSIQFEVRETLVDTFSGPDGQVWYRGERWERVGEQAPWQFRQTFTQTVMEQAAFRSEDNLTFTKLVFPVRSGRQWDGHTAFDEFRQLIIGGEFLDVYAGWEYRITDVDETYELNDQTTLDSIIRIEQ